MAASKNIMTIDYSKKHILPPKLFDELETVCTAFIGPDGGKNDQIVAMKDEIMRSTKAHYFCREVNYKPKQVGPHPCNRDGEGLSEARAQSRVQVMIHGGFSKPTMRANSISMQDHPINKHVEEFAVRMCGKSPRYARLEKNMILAGTLGAGHSMHGLAQIIDEVPCDLPRISLAGRMSKQMCFADKGIRSACEDGVMFDEIDYRVEVVFPMVPSIISAALNTVTQVAMGENWHSMLMKITNLIKAAWPSPNMTDIKKMVIKSQPPRPEDVPDMADFVRKWGGLPEGSFIEEISELANLFCPPHHLVAGSFFKNLYDLPVCPSSMPGEFIAALVFAHAKCEHMVQDNICRNYSKADIAGMMKPDKMAKAMEANGMIFRYRKALESSDITVDNRLRLMADFKVAVVESVMQPKWRAGNKKTLTEIASQMTSAICDGNTPNDTTAHAGKSESQQPDVMGQFVQYSNGQVLAIEETSMAAKGFKIGDVVSIKKGSKWEMHKIKDFGKNTVELNPFNKWTGELNQTELVQVSMIDFNSNWRPVKHQIEEYDGVEITASDLDATVLKGMVSSCMGELMKLNRSSLRVFKNPETAVFSEAACGTGEIVIPPVSKTIIAVDDANKLDGKSIMAKIEGHSFKLASQVDKKCYHAFWFLETSSDASKCNLELIEKIIYTKRPSVKTPNNNTVIPVTFTVAVNFKPIAEKDRLVLHRPAAPKQVTEKREAALILQGGASKKAKTSASK